MPLHDTYRFSCPQLKAKSVRVFAAYLSDINQVNELCYDHVTITDCRFMNSLDADWAGDAPMILQLMLVTRDCYPHLNHILSYPPSVHPSRQLPNVTKRYDRVTVSTR
jgi:hypothetical protein